MRFVGLWLAVPQPKACIRRCTGNHDLDASPCVEVMVRLRIRRWRIANHSPECHLHFAGSGFHNCCVAVRMGIVAKRLGTRIWRGFGVARLRWRRRRLSDCHCRRAASGPPRRSVARRARTEYNARPSALVRLQLLPYPIQWQPQRQSLGCRQSVHARRREEWRIWSARWEAAQRRAKAQLDGR